MSQEACLWLDNVGQAKIYDNNLRNGDLRLLSPKEKAIGGQKGPSAPQTKTQLPVMLLCKVAVGPGK